jgi:integrase
MRNIPPAPEGLPIYRVKAAKIPDISRQVFPPSFVMLYDHEMRPIGLFNHFTLTFGVRKRTLYKSWMNTQRSYADDLAVWGMFCYFNEIDILNPSRDDLVNFRATLEEAVSPQTANKYDDDTKSRRMGSVISLYHFAFREGWVSEPVVAADETASTVVYQGYPRQQSSDLSPLTIQGSPPGEKVSFIPPVHRELIFSHLGPDTTDIAVAPSRNRTSAEWAATTGMRVDEIASITLLDILNLDRARVAATNDAVPYEVRGKRSKLRVVMVPIHLLDVTLRYIRTTRAEIVNKLAVVAPKRKPSPALFLNETSANGRDIGNAATKDTLSRAFTKAVLNAGLVRDEIRFAFDDDGNQIETDGVFERRTHRVPMYTIHDERHSFAINEYWTLKRSGDPDPWKKVSALLGHASLSTTVDTYGQHMPLYEASISDALARKVRGYDVGGQHG